jgi:hypothetical protein
MTGFKYCDKKDVQKWVITSEISGKDRLEKIKNVVE